MSEFNTAYPSDDGNEPFSTDPEFAERFHRIEQLSYARAYLARAEALDEKMGDSPLSRSFVSTTGGGGKYPFQHLRIKLKPKNRVSSDLEVVVLRFPTTEKSSGREVNDNKLYVAWQSHGIETAYLLSVDSFSTIDLSHGFDPTDLDEQGEYPSPSALKPADDMAHFTLTTILDHSEFEPDLQAHDPEVTA